MEIDLSDFKEDDEEEGEGGGGGGGGGGGTSIVLQPGSGIVILDASNQSVQTTSGATGPFIIKAVYV